MSMCLTIISELKKRRTLPPGRDLEMDVIDEYTEGVEVTEETLKRIADRSGLPYPYLTLGLYDLLSKPINPSEMVGKKFVWLNDEALPE